MDTKTSNYYNSIIDELTSNTNNTKKNRQKTKKTDMQKMWNLFNSEIIEDKNNNLECVYRNTHTENNLEYEICQSCRTHLFIGEDGFLTCPNKKCGIIYKDNLDQTAEWRYYGADDNHSGDPTRCGMPINPLLKESSYSCKVLCQYKASYEMHKIKRYTEWQSMPYKEKSQYDEFQLISTISLNAGIPKMIIDSAIRFHKQISEAKTFRGLNRDGIIAASIYISCRINDNPRTAREIANIFNLDPSSATKGCKNAVAIINLLENDTENNEKTMYCKTKPYAFIERYCSPLNINKELTKLCQFIAIKIENDNLIPENTPHSIAAGIIYFISQLCNLHISKRDVHTVTSISEVTINKCFKKLELYQSNLIPKSIYDKYVK